MPKKRVLSDFLCRELLYDYVSGRLDLERTKAVEECLKESEDVQDDLRALREGIKYCQTLKQTKATQPYLEFLQKPPKGFSDYLEAWRTLPTPVRIGIESLAVAILVGVSVSLIPKQYAPWSKTSSYTLVEVTKNISTEESERYEQVTTTTVTTQIAADKNDKAAEVTLTTFGPPTTLKQSEGAKLASSIFNMFKAPSPAPVPSTAPVVAAVSTTTTLLRAEIKGRGEIYRVYMNSSKVDELTPQFVEKILALGGEKAGEVQLGWRRQQGSYFHFSLPESNLEQLKSFMQNFGPVRIVREPHGRVMPPGVIRLILWLETTKSKDNTIEKNDKDSSQEDTQ